MTLDDVKSLCLGCLLALAILVSFFAVRTTLRRGSRIADIRCATCLEPWTDACNTRHDTPEITAFKERIRAALESSGSSSPSAEPAESAAPIAPTTTPAIGGSPSPAWAGPDLPDDDEPCIGLCAGCPADCPLLGDLRIQHNAGNGVAGTATPEPPVDRSGQFGMCDYPRRPT